MIDSFINYIKSVKRYSPRTCDVYRKVLEDYRDFFSDDVPDIVGALTPQLIRSYEVHLLDGNKDDARTVNLHLSVLSSFCKYLMKQGLLESNPVHGVSRPKMEKRLPVFYREDSMDKYFADTQYVVERDDMGMKSLYEERLRRLIISILYNTGIRRSELIALNRSSVDFSRGVMSVTGKGDKMREIPLLASFCNEISLYLQSVDTMVECSGTADTPLLVTVKGSRLYPVYVDKAVKTELGTVAGITGKKSPHALRHTLATELLNDGADLNSIKELLGHSSLAATQVYTHNSIEKLKTVYNHAHPRAKSGGNYGDQD